MAKKTGIISGIGSADIFIDLNGNGIRDAGELGTRSNSSGAFVIEGNGKQLKGVLIASGGIDLSSGQASQLTLSAPGNAKVINLFTTLQQAMIEDHGLKPAQAARQLDQALGLKGWKVLNDAPETVLSANKAGSSKAQKSLQAVQIQQQLETLLEIGAAALDGGSASATNALLDSLAQHLASGQKLALDQPATLQALLTQSAAEAGLDSQQQAALTSQAGAVASIIAASNAALGTAIGSVLAQGKKASAASLEGALDTLDTLQQLGKIAAPVLQAAIASGTADALAERLSGEALDAILSNSGQLPDSDQLQGDSFRVSLAADGTVSFSGSARGDIEISIANGTASFTRGDITASTRIDAIASKTIQLNADQTLHIDLADLAALQGLALTGSGTLKNSGTATAVDLAGLHPADSFTGSVIYSFVTPRDAYDEAADAEAEQHWQGRIELGAAQEARLTLPTSPAFVNGQFLALDAPGLVHLHIHSAGDLDMETGRLGTAGSVLTALETLTVETDGLYSIGTARDPAASSPILSLREVTLSGQGSASVTGLGLATDKARLIDASQLAGDLYLTLSADSATIHGAAGGNHISFSAYGSTRTSLLTGSDRDDFISVRAHGTSDSITRFEITSGQGSDTLEIRTGNAAAHVTLRDWQSGDQLHMAGLESSDYQWISADASAPAGSLAWLLGQNGSSTHDLLEAAFSSEGALIFSHAGSSYITAANATAGYGSGDRLLILTGIAQLQIADLG